MCDTLIFVYGTLRRGSTHNHLIAAVADYLMPGHVTGHLYDIGAYPGLLVNPKTKHKVIGEVYRMKGGKIALTSLDDYEGCSALFAYPHEYVRQRADVELDNGKVISAWVYVYNASIKNKPEIKSGDYLQSSAKSM